ncbi:MAG: acetate--CoA ligase family protein [Candidatus Rokubacteria bacterium]|nr:acetate--CoA ligase family protein [Candidatus Rokubacteria bacterium]
MDLTPLLVPRAIAVIGASPDREIIRGRLLHVLIARGFPGTIYPVTRSHGEIHGLKAYASIDDVPGPVDLAIVVIPADGVPDALEACGRRGVKAAAIISSGFAEERGAAGAERQARLRAVIARYGLAVSGPNSEGIANLLLPMIGTFTPVLEHLDGPLLPEAGRGRSVSVISQSGGIAFAYYNRGRPRQLRFTHLVSTGNEVGLEALDYVDWMIDEGRSDIFLLYVETLRTPAKLARVAAKAAAAGTPLVVAKVGRSEAGRRAAVSHTAALAGADQAYDAMFRHHGVIRADDMDEMLDVAAAFSLCPLARGRRVAILSASGGGAVWMADLLSAHGLEVPMLDEPTRQEIDALIPAYGSSLNPVDVTAQAIRQVGYGRIIEILERSPFVDAIVVVGSLAFEGAIQRDIDALTRVAATATKPILFCAYTLASPRATALLAGAGLPAFTSMPGCAKALRALADYAAFQQRRARRTPATPVPDAARADARARLRAAGDILPEDDAKAVLAAYGIPRPAEELAADESAAVAAARRIGYPVALKVQSPQIAHKTEAGALALGLDADAAVREAYRRVVESARRAVPGAEIRGVLVQRMAAPGCEMILGITRDGDFGPMVMVGLGGIHAEVLRDVVVLPPEIDAADARAALDRLRGASLLGGVRGAPPADVDALVDVLVRLARFAADHADTIAEVDLNPVIVHETGKGVSIVDALIVKRRE